MTQARCPTCRRPATEAYRPFCSKRCADVDLQRWFSGRYVIGGTDETTPGQEARRGDDEV